MRRLSVLGAMVSTLLAAACSGSHSPAAPTTPVAEGAMQVLASSAVPGVPSETKVLTVHELAIDASIYGLASKITSWGYLDGRERTFQGQSRHLTFVVSRSMVFKAVVGARSFVAFVRTHAVAFFGSAVATRPLLAQGRSGWLFTPAACACHLANPVFIGVLADGSRVVWLEINGPDATPMLLHRLLDPARSVPTALPG